MLLMELRETFRNGKANLCARTTFWGSLWRKVGLVGLLLGASCLGKVQAGQIKLAWDANQESDLASYRVDYGTRSGAYNYQTNVGKVTIASISGLSDLATYYFVVRAINTSGLVSEPSNEVSGRPTTVTPAVLASVVVSPSSASLTVGQKQSFTAQGRYSDQTSRDLTSVATWTSSSASVAAVGSGGIVTALAGGSATIRATYGGLGGSAAVNVAGVSLTTRKFGNPTRIVIRDNNTAAPYPSVVAVSGMPTYIDKVTLTLTNLSHTWLYDVNVLLVSPAGKKILLMKQAGWKTKVNRINLTFDDAAAPLPSSGTIVSGSYRPSAYGTQSALPGPAPALPYATTLSTLAGSNPNGNWQLYVLDKGAGDTGEIAGGWGLTITAKASSTAGVLSVAQSGSAREELQADPGMLSQIRLHSISRQENGPTRIQIHGMPGQAYLLQRTSDWITWLDVVSGVMGEEMEEVIDPDLMEPGQAYYRILPVELPVEQRKALF